MRCPTLHRVWALYVPTTPERPPLDSGATATSPPSIRFCSAAGNQQWPAHPLLKKDGLALPRSRREPYVVFLSNTAETQQLGTLSRINILQTTPVGSCRPMFYPPILSFVP
jgi:hypothetical protein